MTGEALGLILSDLNSIDNSIKITLPSYHRPWPASEPRFSQLIGVLLTPLIRI